MPDHTGITWAPGLEEVAREEAGEMTKTPVANDDKGYFPPSEEIRGTGAHTDALPGRVSAATSSGSLKAMSDRVPQRALSARSSHNQMRPRTHSKSASVSANWRRQNLEHPGFPNQSLGSLPGLMPSRPAPRSRSSHPGENKMNEEDTLSRQMSVTTNNTPLSSPSLPSQPRTGSSPFETQLMHRLQPPKTTNEVKIEHDTYTGNKMINEYEVMKELGRGEHGKVKLARNNSTDQFVAVKIVPRFSRERRLGRLGAPEDRTRKEVAILKKARHPNVVGLLEVIDDPNLKKVYIVLEYVERGEIIWYKKGVPGIVRIMDRRLQQEKDGSTPAEPTEKELYDVKLARLRHEYTERNQSRPQMMRGWSLEHAGEDDSPSEVSRTGSRQDIPSRSQSQDDFGDDLAGTMYGSYSPETRRDRKFSVATSAMSHLSSEHDWPTDDETGGTVPALTMLEARRAFRDTLLGLEFLHLIGIIHRDIKPANLLVGGDGTVKISDFGVSYLGKAVTEAETDNELGEKDVSQLDDDRELARSVGTPAFWAPEVCHENPDMFEDGKSPKITGALDLWALGISLYAMIYARLPFITTPNRGHYWNICYETVFIPKTRLVPVDTTSREKPTTSAPTSINSNKRLDFEVTFEEVPEHVRDLISRLLVKDPAHRMTIMEAKKHPWVLDGEADPTKFVSGPALNLQPKETILAPDEKEVDRAIVKRSFVERAVATAGKIGNFANSLLRAGTLKGDSRNRASSTATSSTESLPSPAGSASTTKDTRRSSLKADEIANQLKITRDHPLAQSETNSPQEGPSDYFDERRPRAPDRTISHADSAHTVRQQERPAIIETHSEPTPEQEPTLLQAFNTSIGHHFNRLTSQTRSRFSSDRSPSPSRQSSESDIHGAPSVAISTASASGSLELPEILRSPIELAPSISTDSERLMSPPRSMPSTDSFDQISPSAIMTSTDSDTKTTIHAPASSSEAFEQAQAINTRRFIYETNESAAAQAEAEANPRPRSSDECPPSPDDETFLQTQPSASTIASSADVSMNMSNQSFNMPSNASSPPTEGFLSEMKAAEQDVMKTSDTITERNVAFGKGLEDRTFDEEQDGDDSEDEGMMMTSSKR